MIKYILMIPMIFGAAGIVMADFDSDMLAAKALHNDKKYEEAIQAWINIGESRSDPEERFEAIRKAAECARLKCGGEAKALEIADRIQIEPYAKACRAVVYQWAISSSNVVVEFGNENFIQWPEALAAIGYKVRGNAYFTMKMGKEAAYDYLKAFQCSKSRAKWSAMQRLGDTYWKLLDDELIAEACYRKCVSDYGGASPGLQARVNLAKMLLSQKRYDDALKCISGIKIGGPWQPALLYIEAKVYAEMGKKPEAINSLDAALKTVGINQYQKKDCEKMLLELKPNPPQQTTPQKSAPAAK